MPKLVFAHDLPPAAPYTDSFGSYGSYQPLLTVASNGVNPSLAAQYAQAKAAGVDGLSIDTFDDVSGFGNALTAADTIPGFTLAPCLDTSCEAGTAAQTVNKILGLLTSYASLASGHPSAQKFNGKYVVWTYNSGQLSPADWKTIQGSLTASNTPISLYGDAFGLYVNNDAPAQYSEILQEYTDAFDQYYCFGPSAGRNESSFLAGFLAGGKPFAWTVQPGLHRAGGNAPTGNAIGYADAQGTGTLQSGWQDILSKSGSSDSSLCNAAFICTWSDIGEGTAIMPTTDMGSTLSDMSAWYAAQFRGEPPPFSDVRAYLTVQQSAYLGGNALFECTVINPTAKAVSVTTAVQNIWSQFETGDFGGACPPFSITRFSCSLAITPAVIASGSVGGVPCFRLYAAVRDDNTNATLLTLTSARTALFNSPAPAGGGQALYYSVLSNHTASLQPGGSVNISPSGVRTVTLTDAPGTTHSLIQLLHDTRLAIEAYAGNQITASTAADLNHAADNRNDPVDRGFYVVRQITPDGRILYSDPLTTTHH